MSKRKPTSSKMVAHFAAMSDAELKRTVAQLRVQAPALVSALALARREQKKRGRSIP